MKNLQKQSVIEKNIKDRTRVRAVELIEKTKSIRKKISNGTDWDSVRALRDIRYAS